jgi:hypothetical protein
MDLVLETPEGLQGADMGMISPVPRTSTVTPKLGPAGTPFLSPVVNALRSLSSPRVTPSPLLAGLTDNYSGISDLSLEASLPTPRERKAARKAGEIRAKKAAKRQQKVDSSPRLAKSVEVDVNMSAINRLRTIPSVDDDNDQSENASSVDSEDEAWNQEEMRKYDEAKEAREMQDSMQFKAGRQLEENEGLIAVLCGCFTRRTHVDNTPNIGKSTPVTKMALHVVLNLPWVAVYPRLDPWHLRRITSFRGSN